MLIALEILEYAAIYKLQSSLLAIKLFQCIKHRVKPEHRQSQQECDKTLVMGHYGDKEHENGDAEEGDHRGETSLHESKAVVTNTWDEREHENFGFFISIC
ncbi:hypothetical protein D3C85_1535250 [compost metagenome]